jgi:hypothetical protein
MIQQYPSLGYTQSNVNQVIKKDIYTFMFIAELFIIAKR